MHYYESELHHNENVEGKCHGEYGASQLVPHLMRPQVALYHFLHRGLLPEEHQVCKCYLNEPLHVHGQEGQPKDQPHQDEQENTEDQANLHAQEAQGQDIEHPQAVEEGDEPEDDVGYTIHAAGFHDLDEGALDAAALIVQRVIQILTEHHEDGEDRGEQGDQESHDERLDHCGSMRDRLETMI